MRSTQDIVNDINSIVVNASQRGEMLQLSLLQLEILLDIRQFLKDAVPDAVPVVWEGGPK